MTEVDEMWAALTAYQPCADKAGHGDSWRKMCEDRTKDAIGVAFSVAICYVTSTNTAADAAFIAWVGGDPKISTQKIKSITK